jgi:hypothetical protein
VVSIHDRKKRVVDFRFAGSGQVILAGFATERETEKMSGLALPILLFRFCPVRT